MDNIKDDLYFVTKIKEDLAFILKHMKNVDSEELRQNEILQDSMLFRLIQASDSESFRANDPSALTADAFCCMICYTNHTYEVDNNGNA